MDIEIVRTDEDLEAFIDFPHDLYRATPHYVPQLFRQQRELLDSARSPFAEHAETRLFLAVDKGRVVGRAAAIDNDLYNRVHGSRLGFFGFFDCREDQETASLLLRACADRLRARGLVAMRGPVNPDMNNSCGILVDGFDEPPSVFMPFNAPYYGGLLEGAGLEACMGLNAWDIRSDLIPEAAFRYGDRVAARLEKAGYRLRSVSGSRFERDMEMLRQVYNRSMHGTWGATPIMPAEFREQAAGLKMICKREYIRIVECEGRIVAFIGAAPNLNEILKDIPRGRLLPTGWAKLLLRRRSIKGSRIVMYGVDPDHRGRGLAIWLYVTIIRTLRRNGFDGAEASYVLAANKTVNDLAARLGGRCRKRYAIFERSLEGSP